MIDIIIPAYNAHNTIEKTLLSIVMQNICDKVKVYIVNDNSEQNYSLIIKKFENFLNIKFVGEIAKRANNSSLLFPLNVI